MPTSLGSLYEAGAFRTIARTLMQRFSNTNAGIAGHVRILELIPDARSVTGGGEFGTSAPRDLLGDLRPS